MTSRWKLLTSTFQDTGGGSPLEVEYISTSTDQSGANPDTYTVNCSTITASDALIILYQGEGSTSISSVTAAGAAATIDLAGIQANAVTFIARVSDAAIIGNASVSIVVNKGDDGFRSGAQFFRLVNGATAEVFSTGTDGQTGAGVLTTSVDFSEGVLFASALFPNGEGHTFTAGIETQYVGVQNGSGSGDGGISTTPTTTSHTVTYTQSGNTNTQGEALSVVVYSNGSGGGGGGGGGGGQPVGLSNSLLTLTGQSTGYTLYSPDISAFSGNTVRLVIRYENLSSQFTADIQVDNIDLDGNVYSFENQTHGFETNDGNSYATYAAVNWANMLVEDDNRGRWQAFNQDTPSSNTGDAGAQSGTYFIYAEMSSPANDNGFTTWARSQEVTLSGNPSLDLYVARNGANIGQLDIYLEVTA